MSRHYLFAALWRGTTALLVTLLSTAALLVPAPAQAQSGITSPTDGASINGAVNIFGTAVIEPFQKYELHYKQEPSGDDAYIYFDGGTVQVTNGQLGVWQAGGLPPGNYSLRLRVVKNDGNYAEYYTRNLSVNQGAVAAPDAPEEDAEEAESDEGEAQDEASTEPTPTPIPTATFTPAPQPTPVVGQVTQPELNIAPTPTPTPEEVAIALAPGGSDASGQQTGDSLAVIAEPNVASPQVSGSVTRELGEALSLNRLRTSFFNGVRFSAALFFGAIAIYAGKRLFDWAWAQFS
jgi:hypothetical protein